MGRNRAAGMRPSASECVAAEGCAPSSAPWAAGPAHHAARHRSADRPGRRCRGCCAKVTHPCATRRYGCWSRCCVQADCLIAPSVRAEWGVPGQGRAAAAGLGVETGVADAWRRTSSVAPCGPPWRAWSRSSRRNQWRCHAWKSMASLRPPVRVLLPAGCYPTAFRRSARPESAGSRGMSTASAVVRSTWQVERYLAWILRVSVPSSHVASVLTASAFRASN